jgi:electron-transferring-flavoprotein dehydrogenase
MKSAMIASEVVFHAIKAGQTSETLNYRDALNKTWVMDELYEARNIRPAFRKGLWVGLAYAAIDTYLLKGRAPWTFKTGIDHLSLSLKTACKPIVYPAPDGVLTFDRLSSVYLSGTFHEENQPCHLKLADAAIPIDYNLKLFDAPEQRYCPAGVYEIVINEQGTSRLQINASNCVHCKTCDIKDPLQNITWVPAEGGGGPNYRGM